MAINEKLFVSCTCLHIDHGVICHVIVAKLSSIPLTIALPGQTTDCHLRSQEKEDAVEVKCDYLERTQNIDIAC